MKFIYRIIEMFLGEYQNENSDIEKIKNELSPFDKTPTFADDKENLRSDFNNVLNDTHRAFEKLKTQYNG